ncbi:MAG: response regulator [Desulfobacterales bacterium]|jgi:two-component system, OmpR family, response regulator BaeR
MAHEHILIVEDERKLADLLRDYLSEAGYTVSWLDRGDRVVSRVKQDPPGLVLLDIMLPGTDGTEVCREIRKFSKIPILMITARVEEVDRIIGLELGADDYICKPFSPREVVARVKAVLRRAYSEPETTRLAIGPISLNETTRRVSVDDEVLNLTPSEFGLLKIMMAHPGRVFSRSELLDKVQGYQFEGYDRTIDTHIKNIRKKIAEKLPGRDVIHTVYGIGYKFDSETE